MRSAKRWREPGLLVETLPADQDRRQTPPARSLATSLPWQEVATLFRCAWGTVERAVEDAVSYGFAYRDLTSVTHIGIDEISRKKCRKC